MIARQTSKQDLASKLYPESVSTVSAMQQLRREIRETANLSQELEDLGSLRKHSFNSQQVEKILERFEVSVEEYEKL